MTEFHTLRFGNVNVYLVRGRDGYLLVDAGFPCRENGLAFVGDLAPNDLPFGLGPIYNAIGEDGPLMLKSWEVLLRAGARTILPAHGTPFDAARLQKALHVWKSRLGV